MAVLSAPSARSIWHRTSVPVWALVHVLVLLALFHGIRNPSAPVDPPTFEMIEVSAAPRPEPEAVSDAPPVAPEVPRAAETPAEPVPPSSNATPAPRQATEQDPVTEPTVQTVVAASAGAPAPGQTPPEIPPFRPVTPKPVHTFTPRSFVSRPVPRRSVTPEASPRAASPAAPTAGAGTAQSEQRAEEWLRGRIRDAVQAAVRCPAAARMMALSGKAGVAFDYRDGALIGGAALTRSTGVPMLDAAALAAVRDARYPVPPTEVTNHLLRLLIWVEEACGS